MSKSVSFFPQALTRVLLLGVRFADDVYYSMSQGLLDVSMIEALQNDSLDELVLTPSFLVKDAT